MLAQPVPRLTWRWPDLYSTFITLETIVIETPRSGAGAADHRKPTNRIEGLLGNIPE